MDRATSSVIDGRDTGPERIEHSSAPGVVIQRDGDVVVAVFERHGYRTLCASILEEEELVEPSR
jgi:hypothetical protein